MSYFRVIIQMRWSRTKVVTLSRRRNRKYFVLGLNMTTQFCLNLSQYCGTATPTFVAQDTSLTNCTTLFLPRKNEMSGPHFLFQSNSKIITIALAGHIFCWTLKMFRIFTHLHFVFKQKSLFTLSNSKANYAADFMTILSWKLSRK